MLRPTLVGRSLLLYGHHVRCHSRPSGTSVSAGRAVGARRASGARSNGSPSAASSAHGTGPRARRLQDRESDTEYDTRRRAPGGALDGVSQTAVYDTCGSAPSASHRRTAPSRWTCSATPCGPRASTRGGQPLPRRRVRRLRRPPGHASRAAGRGRACFPRAIPWPFSSAITRRTFTCCRSRESA